MDYEKQIMLEEIKLQPGFVKQNARPTLNNLLTALESRDLSRINHIFITGCGDSYYSALANRMSLMETTGVYVEAIEALEFSRYVVNHMPANSAVIGVSNSGTVSRTIEAVARARQKGALTFAITTKMEAPLAQAADIPLIVNSPPNIKERPDGPPVVTPGTVTYVASLVGVYCVGLAMGLRLGNLNENAAKVRLAELERLSDDMSVTIESLTPAIHNYAIRLAPHKRVIILGGGPNFATAHFGVAKLFEALRHPASAVEMEEWAHEEYFVTDQDAEVFVIVPPGNLRDRAFEQMKAAKDMGATVIAIGSEKDSELFSVADAVFAIKGQISESLSPFLYCIPFELFARSLSQVRNRAFLGFDDGRRREVNFRQIFNSQIRPLEGRK